MNLLEDNCPIDVIRRCHTFVVLYLADHWPCYSQCSTDSRSSVRSCTRTTMGYCHCSLREFMAIAYDLTNVSFKRSSCITMVSLTLWNRTVDRKWKLANRRVSVIYMFMEKTGIPVCKGFAIADTCATSTSTVALIILCKILATEFNAIIG